jgi:hypothetical protein
LVNVLTKNIFFRALALSLLGINVNDNNVYHHMLRVHSILDLAALYEIRTTDARAQRVLNRWNLNLTFDMGNNRYNYNGIENYIRMMLQPASYNPRTMEPLPDNIFRWGSVTDTFAVANVTRRRIISFIPVMEGHERNNRWVY